jgi:predicted amino acid dehydrogenase
MGSAAKADIVLLLTNDPAARIAPTLPRPGSVVIDFAQPPNIPTQAYAAFEARGVQVVQGGLVRIPGYRCTYDLRLPGRDLTFACLAETYLFAREGIREHSVGQASVELGLYLERAAARHGVRARELGIRSPAAIPA